MNFLKDYKGMMIIFLIITIVNVLWVVNAPTNEDKKQVRNDTSIVLND